MTNAIETHGLSRRFFRTEAISDLDLEVPEGSIFALLGPNGAGKTTTLKMMMNLIRPTAGRATVLGIDSRRLAPKELARIGYVSENQQLPQWMTVAQLLAYVKPFYPTWDDRLCDRLLEMFELPLDRKLRHLSRGMKIKAAMVSSLAYRPELLVLDEPLSGLDPVVRDDLIEGLLERSEENGWTVLISSHDVSEVERLADRVAFLTHGRLLLSEEMVALQERFRAVEVFCFDDVAIPSPFPSNWSQPKTSGTSLRFVDSRYAAELLEKELRSKIQGIREISAKPMALRDIFVALARGKKPAEVGS